MSDDYLDICNRSDVEKLFAVQAGRIISTGMFESEAIYVPYFWSKGINGWADSEREEADSTTMTFTVCPEDVAEFPELKGKRQVVLQSKHLTGAALLVFEL